MNTSSNSNTIIIMVISTVIVILMETVLVIGIGTVIAVVMILIGIEITS